MATVRLCICPCGHLGVQEITEDPLCHSCGEENKENIDWFNMEAETLVEDLEFARDVIEGLLKKIN